MINYESGRAFALSSLSQDILHTPEAFKAWTDNLVAALKKPVETPKPAAPHIVIYTDGACSGNPGPGGYGAVLMVGDYRRELSGYVAEATNNRMELLAAIHALSALKKPCVVTLHSDSSYLVNAFERNWLDSWQKNGWKNSRKEAVENQDLWQQLLDLTTKHAVTFIKVKGHADNEWNNRCDQLAVAAIKEVGGSAA